MSEANQNNATPRSVDQQQACPALLDAALDLLAGWCDAVKNGGTGWDDWDEWYKDACYRPGPLRDLLDAKIAKLEACSMCGGSGEIPSLDVTPIEPTEPCPQCKPNSVISKPVGISTQ
jgi:hypothetical protein